MDELSIKRKARRRRGQTLAEFSLTLPILLLLTFGTIEFGRIFQAWVTIQNAAREATRYVTTGQYNKDKYDVDVIVPCSLDTEPAVRNNYRANAESPVVEVYGGTDPITGEFIQAEEDMYATWYDGEDCDESAESLERRKDILRVASAMDVARIGASGLSLERSYLDGSPQSVTNMLLNQWANPAPRSDQPGYFNVVICSSRGRLNPDPAADTASPEHQTRFVTIYDETDIPSGYNFGFETPYCMRNEIQPASAGALNNPGIPWLDPGGPGDRVSVFVTFNHPLITPLGLAEYVTMNARRSGVNESFRASRALNAVQGAPPGVEGIDTPTPLPPSITPLPTETFTFTPENTDTPTPTPTDPPPPFDCAALNVSNLQIFGQRVFIDIENRNAQTTELERVYLSWYTPPAYPGMYLASESVNTEVFWFGERNVAPFDTAVDLSADETTEFLAANRTIPGNFEVSVWEGLYLGAGLNLVDAGMNQWDWGGSKFYFLNPETGTQCEVELLLPPEPDPEEEEDPLASATPTFTPDCASSTLAVNFIQFDTFGVIELEVVNNRYQPAPMLGFEINWTDPASLSPNQTGVFTLRKISAGGRDADDFGQADSEGVLLWRGRENWGDGGSLGDRAPTTRHTEGVPAEGGYWRDDYVFPPRSRTSLFLDFEGTTAALDLAFGVGPWMLNGTFFDLGCGGSGGSGGSGGGGSDGTIFISEIPEPPPTRTPAPTRTPGPTLTPSPTRPSPTPSKTWTPGPTPTPRPTDTPEPTSPGSRPTRVPTQDGSGGELP